MNFTLEHLQAVAASTGFRQEILEKVLRLLGLLTAMRSHPYVRDRVALKGGTALNLFVFDVPRLSIDIDLNYIGAVDRETMLAERPRLEQAILAVCSREGLTVRRAPTDHAGGKWRLSYASPTGQNGNLEVDINFMLRSPLWPLKRMDSHTVGTLQATQIPLLDLHELAGGKIAALLARTASRDLFDTCALLRHPSLKPQALRLAFVVYGAMNRRDWRTVSVDNVNIEPTELTRLLLPTLRQGEVPQDAARWGRELVEQCRDLMCVVLPFTTEEREFLERLNGRGQVVPEVLTADVALQSSIRAHPQILWKAEHARKHSGGG